MSDKPVLREVLRLGSLVLLASLGPSPSLTASVACSSEAHRQFDFWLGDWQVDDGADPPKVLGHNQITRTASGCALRELWRGVSGKEGSSLNAWDATRQRWTQHWIGADGVILRLEGGWDGTAMQLEGVLPHAAGGEQAQRIRWIPRADGSVEQRWETRDPGEDWKPAFVGHYRRLDPEGQPEAKASYWQDLARKDLDAVREAIREIHPGAIDEQNPAFAQWIEQGHARAGALVPRVINYDTMLAAVRHYVGGFRDGHLVYSDDLRGQSMPMRTTGWSLGFVEGEFRVAGRADIWPSALPDTGWTLLACDGRTLEEIWHGDHAPYLSDQSGLPHPERHLAYLLSQLRLAGSGLRECRFRDPDGVEHPLAIRYQDRPTSEVWDWWTSGSRSRPRDDNGFERIGKALWIRAANFAPDPQQMEALEVLLDQIRKERGHRAIVFDARGNGGGNSGVGWRIFEAATGGLEYDENDLDRLPQTHALWRVSAPAIARMTDAVARSREVYGESSEEYLHGLARVQAMRTALTEGRDWVRQDDGPRLDRAEMEARKARLKHFDGRIALLVDHRCVSACLDFADLIAQVPGSLRLGETTGADAVYIDGGARVELPGGNRLFLPLKVWRNRLRGHNEPYTPDLPIDLDAIDEAELRKQVLRAVTNDPRR
jgi:hypothetical protein